MTGIALPGDDGAPALRAARVSVLMPMRNPGRFLHAAVASVLEQPCPDLELIVIDDGSTDGSREWLAALADRRIVQVDGPRAGISACLNAGLARVTGDVVMRCDADDLYPAGRVAAQLAWLDQHPEHIAVCAAFTMIGPDDAVVAQPFRQVTAAQLDGAARILDGRLRTHLCTFAIRTAALQRVGPFRTFFETAEDIDFALRLAEVGPVGFEPRNDYLYRLHDASVTHTQASARRRFFETCAYEMSRERQATGADALMRGDPPSPPVADAGGARADGAALHLAQLLVGESWRAFARGDRRSARRAALRAIKARPVHLQAWKALLMVSLRPLAQPPAAS
jgi:glycosyltransferase involved in cell wall biosynthesis